MIVRLADAAFLIALLNRRDRFHAWASDYFMRTRDRLVLTMPVILEVGNYFADSKFRSRVISFLRRLQQDPRLECVDLRPYLLEAGMEYYASRLDQEWGLTDCISFVLMEERGILEAVTTDHHSEQAGFTILMKS